MRNMKLHTICILGLALTVSINAKAACDVDPNMEANVSDTSNCSMFHGNYQTGEAIRGFSKLPVEAKLLKVHNFQDHAFLPANHPEKNQFSAVSELSREVSNGVEYGSSVVLSPCFVLTNHHVAYGDDTNPVLGKDYSMTFRGGVGDDGGFYGHTTAHPVKSGDYANSKNGDWAIMKLDRCAGKLEQVGWAEQANKPAAQIKASETIAMVGMSQAQRSTLKMSVDSITGLDQTTKLLRASTSVAHGESGGGVYVKEDGVTKLAGLIVGELKGYDEDDGRTYDDAHASLFISTYEILNRPDIKAMLDADKAKVQFQNPASKNLARPLPSYLTQTASS